MITDRAQAKYEDEITALWAELGHAEEKIEAAEATMARVRALCDEADLRQRFPGSVSRPTVTTEGVRAALDPPTDGA